MIRWVRIAFCAVRLHFRTMARCVLYEWVRAEGWAERGDPDPAFFEIQRRWILPCAESFRRKLEGDRAFSGNLKRYRWRSTDVVTKQH